MAKRASSALQFIAVLEIVNAVKMLIIGLMRDDVLNHLRSGLDDSSAVFAKLKLYSQISLYTHVGILALLLTGVVLLAISLQAGRVAAALAATLFAVDGALLAVEQAIKIPDPLPLWLKALWLGDGAILSLALFLPLLAGARARPSASARLGVSGALAIVLLNVGATAYGWSAKTFPQALTWIERAIDVGAAAWFASFAFPLAKRLGTDATPDAAPTSGQLDGTPLRTLAYALLMRIGVGIALAILSMVSVANGEYASAGALSTTGAAIGGLISIVIVVALIQYLRFPQTHRGESLIVAIGLVVLGVVLDIVGAISAGQLFDMVGEAQHATSFWGMPSLSKMEELQDTVSWVGRGALLLGIGAGLALAASLKKTAEALADSERIARAKRVIALLIVAGVGALVVGLLLQVLPRDAGPLLLIVGLGLLVVAIMLLADWMRLLFGLASELERPAKLEPS